MSREITVSLDLTVQPKQYQSIKLGLTVKEMVPEDGGLADQVNTIRREVSKLLKQGLYEEIEAVYGAAVATYCVNQCPDVSVEPRRAPVVSPTTVSTLGKE